MKPGHKKNFTVYTYNHLGFQALKNCQTSKRDQKVN